MTAYLGQFFLPKRHRGMGSLPSATITVFWVWIRELAAGAELLGSAQYIPSNATAVRNTSTALLLEFMGESPTAYLTPAEV